MIRKHTPTDLDQILHIWYESSTKAHPFLPADFVEKVKADMRNLYVPGSETWVYENEAGAIGFVSMMDNEIGGLFVLPQNQAIGVGTKLLNFVQNMHKRLEVEVFEQNEIGRSFYQKHGFEFIKEYKHEESGEVVLRLGK